MVLKMANFTPWWWYIYTQTCCSNVFDYLYAFEVVHLLV